MYFALPDDHGEKVISNSESEDPRKDYGRLSHINNSGKLASILGRVLEILEVCSQSDFSEDHLLLLV